VSLIRGHQLAALIVGLAVVATSAFFVLARPQYERETIPPPPDHGLDYDTAIYSPIDVRRAFAAEGVRLKLRATAPTVTSLLVQNQVLAVDVFGDRQSVERAGFYDYTMIDGKYVRFPTSCSARATSAVRWHENVRAVVSCGTARGATAEWFRKVERAFARLRTNRVVPRN
jgi:hypothetical protein